MSRTSETEPWKDGYWQTKIPDVPGSDIICVVKGSDVSIKCGELNDVMGKWAFGKFEMASKKLKKKTGISETNIRMVYDLGHLGSGTQVFHGILTKTLLYQRLSFQIWNCGARGFQFDLRNGNCS